MDVQQHRARGVGDVGRVNLAARQAPKQETVDGAEGQFAALGAFARPRHIVQCPCKFSGREIWIEQQTRPRADELLGSLALEARALVGRASILPNNGIVNWYAARAVPYDRRFALIRDSESGDVVAADTGLLDGGAGREQRIAPNI